MKQLPPAGSRYTPLLLITLAVVIAYIPVFSCDFTNWDDDVYVTGNTVIAGLTGTNIKAMFTSFFAGNYQPLLILSYCLDYLLDGLNPQVFHFVNLLIHVLNCILVYSFARKIFRQPGLHLMIAVLFAVHPLHVEPVTWISGRKDLLYTFFFLLSLNNYYLFATGNGKKYYVWTLFFFACSLLSKATAVSFCAVVFLFDRVLERKVAPSRQVLEKLPFILLAILFGLIAIKAQIRVNAIYQVGEMTWYESLMNASYALTSYCFRFIFPSGLSAFYPYLPGLHWEALLAISAALVSWIAKFRSLPRMVNFGLLFFVCTIVLLLQLVPVGNALIADRYMYLPMLGLLIALGGVLESAAQKAMFRVALTLVVMVFVSMTYMQAMTWRSSITLWNNVIKYYPETYTAYNNRGLAYAREQSPDKAMNDFDKAISINPAYSEAYSNRGMIYDAARYFEQAIQQYDKAISLNSGRAEIYSNRGFALLSVNRLEEAMRDLDRAISLQPAFAIAYNNRGLVKLKLKDYAGAKADIRHSLELLPGNAYAWRNLALLYIALENGSEACVCLMKAEELGFSKLYGNEVLELLKQCGTR